MSLIESIRSRLIHPHGFQQLVPLPQFIEIAFFVCTRSINLLNLKQRSQARNRCKRVLKAAKRAYVNKAKESITSQIHGSRDFWRISTKVNLLYLLYSTAQRCYLLHLIKQNCLLKTFLRTTILMTQVSLSLFSLLELI